MANGHGGRRPGAGRKSRSEKFARPIAAAEKRVASLLPQLVENLESLANGGYQRTREKWTPAGLVLVDGVIRDKKGDPVLDADGVAQTGRVPAFPELKPDQLILVERHTERADADRAANIYLVDRILGKPVQAVEADVTSGGEALQQVVFYIPDNGRDPGEGDPAAGGASGDVPQ